MPTVEREVTRIENVNLCDWCGKPTENYFACDGCGRWACSEHRKGWVDGPLSLGYPDWRYCPGCWEIGKVFRRRQADITDQIDELTAESKAIPAHWAAAAKAVMQTKNTSKGGALQ